MEQAVKQVEKAARYRQLLRQVVHKQAKVPRRVDQAQLVPICDDETGNYLLMRIGWDRRGRAHNILFHLRLIDEQVLIEWDGIERGISRDLIAAGISKADIQSASQNKISFPQTESLAA